MVMVGGSKRAVRYRQAPRVLLAAVLGGKRGGLRSAAAAISRIRARPDAVDLHGLEIVRRARHVLEVRQRLQRLDDLAHHRPGFRVPAETPGCQLRRFLGAFYREMPLQPRIYQPIKPPPVTNVGPRPFHEVMLPVGSVLVHRSPTCNHFKKHYTKAVDIALRCQMP